MYGKHNNWINSIVIGISAVLMSALMASCGGGMASLEQAPADSADVAASSNEAAYPEYGAPDSSALSDGAAAGSDFEVLKGSLKTRHD
jgi:hypothetical protein